MPRPGPRTTYKAREGKIVTKGIEVEKDVAAELKALRKVKRD